VLQCFVVLLAVGLGACGSLISNTKEVEIGTGVDGEIESEYRIAAEDDPVSLWARDLEALGVFEQTRDNLAAARGFSTKRCRSDDVT
jgi:hypothetical protein